MEAASPAIRPALILPRRTDHFAHVRLSFASIARPQSNRKRIRRRVEARERPEKSVSAATNADFSDPDWKTKYQEDFEARFRIPHVTDVINDAVSYPSTFCLRMRFVNRLCYCQLSIEVV